MSTGGKVSPPTPWPKISGTRVMERKIQREIVVNRIFKIPSLGRSIIKISSIKKIRWETFQNDSFCFSPNYGLYE